MDAASTSQGIGDGRASTCRGHVFAIQEESRPSLLAVDLTTERASEIRTLRNKGRRILHAMEGIEARMQADNDRVERNVRSLGLGDHEHGLPLDVELGLMLFHDYDRSYEKALGWNTREWTREVDTWCDLNGVSPSSEPFPQEHRGGNGRSGAVRDLRWEVVPSVGRKKIYRLEQWRDVVAACREAVESRVRILDDQLLLLGRGPNSASTPALLRSWDLIRQTGAFDAAMLRGLIESIETRSTKKQVRASLAASKELLEGVLRGILRARGFTAKEIKALKMLPLFDACRDLLFAEGDRAVSDSKYATGLMLSGVRDVVQGLTELRNAAGDGHGSPSYVAGLTTSHAAFVGDIAYAVCALFAEQELRTRTPG